MPKTLEVRIHITSQSTFKGCRLRYWFTDRDQQAWESRRPQYPLMTGSAVHAGLEGYYNTKETVEPAIVDVQGSFGEARDKLPQDVLPEELVRIDEEQALAEAMIRNFGNWAVEDDRKLGLRVLVSELDFDVPFKHPTLNFSKELGFPVRVYLHGTIDSVYRREGDLTIGEYKTTAIGGEGESQRLQLEEQAGIYQYALQYMVEHYDEYGDYLWPMDIEEGDIIQGVLYTFLRKKIPSIPKTLKAGGFSIAKNIDTTIEVWEKTLRDAGEDPDSDHYRDFTLRLRGKGNTFFHREEVHRGKKELDLLMTRVFWTAVDMINPKTVMYPSPDPMKCRICPMQGPCIALNTGADYKFVLEENFRRRRSDA